MNITADYANDFLRKSEDFHNALGRSTDYIYVDRDFIDKCYNDEKIKISEISKYVNICNKYLEQFGNRESEIEYIRHFRHMTDEITYARLIKNSLRRRRKALQRMTNAKSRLEILREELKEIQVLRRAQRSGMRRFWDHPVYGIDKINSSQFYGVVGWVEMGFALELIDKAA